jgi:hypothetical protein
MSDHLKYEQNEAGNFAIPCQVKMSDVCAQVGEFCETKEDAYDWVEEDFWIFSGEGFICNQCNEYILRNISKLKNKDNN